MCSIACNISTRERRGRQHSIHANLFLFWVVPRALWAMALDVTATRMEVVLCFGVDLPETLASGSVWNTTGACESLSVGASYETLND